MPLCNGRHCLSFSSGIDCFVVAVIWRFILTMMPDLTPFYIRPFARLICGAITGNVIDPHLPTHIEMVSKRWLGWRFTAAHPKSDRQTAPKTSRDLVSGRSRSDVRRFYDDVPRRDVGKSVRRSSHREHAKLCSIDPRAVRAEREKTGPNSDANDINVDRLSNVRWRVEDLTPTRRSCNSVERHGSNAIVFLLTKRSCVNISSFRVVSGQEPNTPNPPRPPCLH